MFFYNLLDQIPWISGWPYKTKSALVRAIKAGLAVTVGILLTAAASNVLFPSDWSPVVVIAITAILQAADKYLRESSNENSGDNPPPTT